MLRLFCTSLPVALGIGILTALCYYFNSRRNNVQPHEYESHFRTEWPTAFTDSTNDCCGICLEDMGGRDQKLGRLECNHRFHLDCTRDILTGPYAQKSCPLCRKAINPNKMTIEYS